MMTGKRTICFFVILLIVSAVLAQGEIGELCTVRLTRRQGICKLAAECSQVEELAKNGISPTICGFQYNTIPIVCCPETANAQPNENSFLNVNIDNSESFVFPEPVDTTPHPPPSHKRKSEEKCEEYSKLVTGVVNAVPLITDPEEITINVVKCDYTGVALIVGGSPASAGEFPFMGAVGYNDEEGIGWYCGATLISEHYVITAAHCANTKYYGAPVKVRLGDLDLKRDDDGAQYVDYDIVEIKIHERYHPPARYNDIALIRLSPKVEFTNFIRPACLWTRPTFDHNKTVATGWGKTGTADDQSDRLLKVALNILDNSVCSKTYPPASRTLPNGIQSTMMCAGELKGGKDTCQGDSGGPLIVSKKGNQCIFNVVGITSFGKGCGGPNLPAVYTRVSEYVPWIENIIW